MYICIYMYMYIYMFMCICTCCSLLQCALLYNVTLCCNMWLMTHTDALVLFRQIWWGREQHKTRARARAREIERVWEKKRARVEQALGHPRGEAQGLTSSWQIILLNSQLASQCCSVVQCGAVCCSVLLFGVVCCSVLQCVAFPILYYLHYKKVNPLWFAGDFDQIYTYQNIRNYIYVYIYI